MAVIGFRKTLAGAAMAAVISTYACGGGDTGPGDSDDVAAVPTVEEPPRPGPREELSAADLGGVDRAKILLTLPWSGNRVSRDASEGEQALLQEVLITREPGFDRVLLEFEGGLPGYEIGYVAHPIAECGSGDERSLPGEAVLVVRLLGAVAHTEQGRPTVTNRSQEPGYPSLLAAELTCDFEGTVEWAIGVQEPVSYRVLELRDGPRLAVDLRHGIGAGS